VPSVVTAWRQQHAIFRNNACIRVHCYWLQTRPCCWPEALSLCDDVTSASSMPVLEWKPKAHSFGNHTWTMLRMCRMNFFISVRFRFGFLKKLVFGSEWVWFGSVKKRALVQILWLFTTRVIANITATFAWHDFDVTHNNDNN